MIYWSWYCLVADPKEKNPPPSVTEGYKKIHRDALGENLGEEEHLLFLFPLAVVGGLLGDRELDLLLLVSGVGYTGCQDEKGVLGEGGAYSGDRMITESSSSVGGLIRMMEPTAEESRS